MELFVSFVLGFMLWLFGVWVLHQISKEPLSFWGWILRAAGMTLLMMIVLERRNLRSLFRGKRN